MRGIAQTTQLRENPLATQVTAGRRGRPRKVRGPDEIAEAEQIKSKRQKHDDDEGSSNINSGTWNTPE